MNHNQLSSRGEGGGGDGDERPSPVCIHASPSAPRDKATTFSTLNSHHPAHLPEIVGDAPPTPPVVPAKTIPINMNMMHKRLLEPSWETGQTKIKESFLNERKRADDAVAEAHAQNRRLNKLRVEYRNYVAASQSFMKAQQKKLNESPHKVANGTNQVITMQKENSEMKKNMRKLEEKRAGKDADLESPSTLSTDLSKRKIEDSGGFNESMNDDKMRTPPRKKRLSSEWTEPDIERLNEIMLDVATATTPKWDKIANKFKGRTAVDCLTQWQRMSIPSQVKGKGSWTPSEDAILRAKYIQIGSKWSKIASYLPGRSG